MINANKKNYGYASFIFFNAIIHTYKGTLYFKLYDPMKTFFPYKTQQKTENKKCLEITQNALINFIGTLGENLNDVPMA